MDPEDPNPTNRPDAGASIEPLAPGDPALPTTGSAFKVNRQTATLGGLVSAASDAWRRDVGTWALAMVLVLVIGTGIPMVLGFGIGLMDTLQPEGEANRAARALMDGLNVGLQILQILINGFLTMGLWAMAFHALEGRPAPIAALFSQIRKVWRYLLQQFVIFVPIIAVVVAIGVVVVLVSVGTIDLDMPLEEAVMRIGPSLWWLAMILVPILTFVLLGVVFAVNELTYDDAVGAVESVVRSWRIAKGHRWLILATLFIAGLVTTASFMLCGVGILFGAPFATLMMAALYLALRNGADVPEPDATSTLGTRY
ncbi:MAG: DUF975 family protein [Myxococcota bacterium]